MTRSARQLIFSAIALLSAAFLALVLANREVLRDPKPPQDLPGMARWLAAHPADWEVASSLSEAALDSELPGRVAMWRAGYAHAKRLAPPLTAANEKFVRAGLFHWYELGAPERALILDAASPLMRDPAYFDRMHVSFWQLTRDLAWLRRVAPENTTARDALRRLAIARGLFADYRVLRDDLHRSMLRAFEKARRDADLTTLLNLLPPQIDREDEPLVRGILAELDRRPFEAAQMTPVIAPLVEYALRHDVRPLTGIVPLLRADTPLLADVLRARAALEINDPALASRIEMTTGLPGAAEWDPYYIDRARFEARRRNAPSARLYLGRAALGGTTLEILAATEEVETLLGHTADQAHTQLMQRTREPRAWTGTCGVDELCSSATANEYVRDGAIDLTLTAVQSDETPPYVEIYVDDARVDEGEVRGSRAFRIPAAAGLREIEVRLVNARTRNGIQRRVRLS